MSQPCIQALRHDVNITSVLILHQDISECDYGHLFLKYLSRKNDHTSIFGDNYMLGRIEKSSAMF